MQSKPLPPRPDLDALLVASAARCRMMSPDEMRDMIARQRKSWVIGEMMIERPSMTREEAEVIYNTVI